MQEDGGPTGDVLSVFGCEWICIGGAGLLHIGISSILTKSLKLNMLGRALESILIKCYPELKKKYVLVKQRCPREDIHEFSRKN